jgi:hypothetical protein
VALVEVADRNHTTAIGSAGTPHVGSIFFDPNGVCKQFVEFNACPLPLT